MIKDWFKNRLTDEKQKSQLLSSFAEAVQTLFESEISPLLNRISQRKSFFSMSSEDLATRASEYGRFFVIGEVESDRKPMLLTQRLDEVHFKGTIRPIEQTFWREFGNLPVSWEPLYAPVDLEKYPYCSYLITEDIIPIAETTYGQFFLTSRGNIQVDLNTLYENYGIQDRDDVIQTLLEKFDLIIAPLLPLHTVFDGVTLQLAFRLTEPGERLRLMQETVSIAGMKWTSEREKLTKFGAAAVTSVPISREGNTEMTQVYLSIDQIPLDAWCLDAPPVTTLVSSQ